MNMQTRTSSIIKDKYYRIDHPTGLTIYVYPKKDVLSTYAIVGTNFGSVNTSFSVDGGEKITVPDGIAHYLEHKLFESEEGDAFTRYALTGADANAYTSFEKTCYLFSCTSKFAESLEILLDLVQSPYFTAQTVAKEQGIIAQEIKMYDDSPEWRVMFNTLVGMYHKHPVRIDIAGTVESIAEITAEKLYDCYNSFYNLHNMVMCIVGNTTVEEVRSLADKLLKPCEKKNVTSYFEEEPYSVAQDYIEQKLPVAMPLFCLGFKQNAEKPATSKELANIDILLQAIASPSSTLYDTLMNEGLINDSFSYEFMEGPHYANIMFEGESRDPKKTAEIIKDYIRKIKSDGIDKEDFEIAKYAVYGSTVARFNSNRDIANTLVGLHFSGNDLFDYLDAVANADIESITAMLDKVLDPDNCTLSVIVGE